MPHVSLSAWAVGQLGFDDSSMTEPTQCNSGQIPWSGPVTFQAKIKGPSPHTEIEYFVNRGVASYSLPALSLALMRYCIL